MRHIVAAVLIVVGFGGFVATQVLSAEAASGPHAALVDIDDLIHSVSAGFLSRAIDDAADDDAQLLIVRLDTPGGLFSSTRDMVGDILVSRIPVVVYVAPSGARAASAGTFITAAAHVAAMAPTTNIGAASPVSSGGEDLPDTLESKATQDAAAFIRSIADGRGRNSQALEETVLSARSFSASEALEENIVDLIATDVDDLLEKLHGKVVSVNDVDVVIETEGFDVRSISRTPVERFLGFIANPDIAFLLLSLGGLGLLVELVSPGLLGPGIIGAIAMALAFVALGNLPVNWTGVGLILLAMALFYVEMQAPGVGVFGIAGAISFVLGGFLLFGRFTDPAIPTPSFRVNLWMIGGVSAALGGSLVLLFTTLLQAKKASYVSPAVDLVGREGTVISPLDPTGTVRVAGEAWTAVSDSGEAIAEGEEVIVLEVEGLTLKVFKASDTS